MRRLSDLDAIDLPPERGDAYGVDVLLCPVIFGAPRANKRCLVLDLEERYSGVEQLRDGVEIQRVH